MAFERNGERRVLLVRDEQSNSLWDHITGECFDGPLSGERMEFWHVPLTTVAAELARNPQAILLKSDYNTLFMRFMMWIHASFSGGNSLINRENSKIPPHFRFSMSQSIDGRLPKDQQGLGVMSEDDSGKFYPMQLLPKGEMVTDVWNGRTLHIERGDIDGVPTARWADGGQPMQLLSRWYGFSFTYPNCDIYEGDDTVCTNHHQ
ncbi:MAG: hypothetical protein DHS20C20_31950 [Ardenticatenaceae bacterium]|nr:MAG: hypothetical protein DHS20C20_31950 [Ardenticatenaceae bacterium]